MCTVPLSQRPNSPKFDNKFPEKVAVPEFFLGGAATLQAPRLVRPMPFASFQSNKFEMIFYKVALIIVYIYLEIFTKTISRLRLGDHKPTFTLAQ